MKKMTSLTVSNKNKRKHQMSFKGLAGRTAIVTGAAGGIGSATVRRLVQEGCKVAAVDIVEASLGALAAELGGAVLPIVADVSQEAECERYVRETVARFGAVHLFVNNAGILGRRFRIVDMPVAEFDRVHGVNVRGVFLGLRAVIRQILAQKTPGAVVNLSSVGALRSRPETAAYGSSKRAVIGLANSAAVEYGHDGIRVNTICPGPINTPMLGPAAGPGVDLNKAFADEPIPRMADPSEVAAFIAYLLSDEASFQTAGVYTIDGGMMH